MIVATVARAPWRLPDVAGEEDLLLTAILNLLGNALKYSSQAEVVELRANEQIIDSHQVGRRRGGRHGQRHSAD